MKAGFWILIVMSALIEVSPIKINPWTRIKKMIQNFIGVQALSDKIDLDNALRYRTEILKFGEECLEKNFSQRSYEDMIDICDRYDDYCKLHPKFKNGVTIEHEKVIRDSYSEKLKTNSFKKMRIE